MHYLKDRGFILKRVNFGESDRYITIFTKNHGKIDVVAKGVRKITSRRASSVEPLNLIEFQSVRSHKNYVLTEVRLIDSFEELKKEIQHIKKVFLMCELIDAVLPREQRHPDVFDLIERASHRMVDNKKNILYFQAKLLTLLGFWNPNYAFKNEDHLAQYTEQIIERKLRSRHIFES
ncbi:MAG: DNA repair protein RecO [Candidatus Levybacteria bacterium RIFCSPHIGHO2_02_FULL_40_18]|nr:MAG: DNA repair protein RecO [Candidatus Levybacteria bacterium RIFCSPHIGHO2_01_FULL_40_58]OGH27155.1 MAG: DNA repair protein RecO [Candidatus Levybacteria bacterium RIFCSPHIGHO2_02_FULL_40_18]OGH31014.1 MAG: DNA repair protein RecO [Candidatus Levybacteria bacterium RIFCSPHIGHO2_12_FULL_40_31]OGH41025.1 MAG: DNA repair protein RecO [Candidatus Levybacteria bacterium RIFCSPLOWO2_01_FULL_40_64]OGH49453.1 MAG: DNA repair protein RecO [Candidatus Levybacteria bacterium RIFCSPLOWO2_02_FULL_41_11